MSSGVSDSEFHVWRALFALAYSDGVLTKEEISFSAEILAEVPFSEEQENIIRGDIVTPRDPVEMFSKVMDEEDQKIFFKYAYQLVWIDGHYDDKERKIMTKLEDMRMSGARVEKSFMEEWSGVRKGDGKNAFANALKSCNTEFLTRRFAEKK